MGLWFEGRENRGGSFRWISGEWLWSECFGGVGKGGKGEGVGWEILKGGSADVGGMGVGEGERKGVCLNKRVLGGVNE